MEYKSLQAKERDLKILHELYRFRVLTIEQLLARLGNTKGSLYHFFSWASQVRFDSIKRYKGIYD